MSGESHDQSTPTVAPSSTPTCAECGRDGGKHFPSLHANPASVMTVAAPTADEPQTRRWEYDAIDNGFGALYRLTEFAAGRGDGISRDDAMDVQQWIDAKVGLLQERVRELEPQPTPATADEDEREFDAFWNNYDGDYDDGCVCAAEAWRAALRYVRRTVQQSAPFDVMKQVLLIAEKHKRGDNDDCTSGNCGCCDIIADTLRRIIEGRGE